MTTSNQIKLGTSVTYISTKGFKKLALVTATPETVTEGHELPELPEGYLHLMVISATGSMYPRLSIPSIDVAKEIPDYAAEGDLELRGVWTTI